MKKLKRWRPGLLGDGRDLSILYLKIMDPELVAILANQANHLKVCSRGSSDFTPPTLSRKTHSADSAKPEVPDPPELHLWWHSECFLTVVDLEVYLWKKYIKFCIISVLWENIKIWLLGHLGQADGSSALSTGLGFYNAERSDTKNIAAGILSECKCTTI